MAFSNSFCRAGILSRSRTSNPLHPAPCPLAIFSASMRQATSPPSRRTWRHARGTRAHRAIQSDRRTIGGRNISAGFDTGPSQTPISIIIVTKTPPSWTGGCCSKTASTPIRSSHRCAAQSCLLRTSYWLRTPTSRCVCVGKVRKDRQDARSDLRRALQSAGSDKQRQRLIIHCQGHFFPPVNAIAISTTAWRSR